MRRLGVSTIILIPKIHLTGALSADRVLDTVFEEAQCHDPTFAHTRKNVPVLVTTKLAVSPPSSRPFNASGITKPLAGNHRRT